MRLLRIRLRNFRGVEDREVAFARDGVTVVVGPNEVGKSSMAEALDLLISHLDSTTKAEVKAVKPVDRDAGPEVEVDIETGPYAFTYRKRFLKATETVLQITRPRPESLTGRQAHERVEQILRETMDADLWRALRVRQGEGLGQPVLADAGSLGQALDRAAGTVPEGQVETSLFERAKAEYDQFWTATGRPKGDLPLRDAILQHQSTVDGLDAQLRSLAADVERDADLTAERAALAAAKGPEEARLVEYEARWRQIEALVHDVER
ncbi:MAG TPA: AAA family ATPase, partial [Candidatus Limnocylindrales bacterium]